MPQKEVLLRSELGEYRITSAEIDGNVIKVHYPNVTYSAGRLICNFLAKEKDYILPISALRTMCCYSTYGSDPGGCIE